jgi:Zn-dependent protease with chaperone function/tellurite resistance protein
VSLAARRDRALREKLLADPAVQRAIHRVDELTSGYGYFQRRRLLTGGIRLTRSMYPSLADTLAECKAILGVDVPVEVYVKNDPFMGASCARAPNGLLSIMLTSSLLQGFSPAELRFVIGHELGHARFDHFAIPMPITATIRDMAGRLVSRPLALEMFVWCRAAEISADRAGLLCARDPEAAAQSFFKLASGLTDGSVVSVLDTFAAQVEALAATPETRERPRDDDDTLDCFCTHPYGSVRVRALVAFSRSALYQRAIGAQVTGDAIGDDQLSAIVERDLDLMEPSYLEEKTAHSEELRRLLFEAGVCVAAANGEIEESELDALRTLLGATAMLGEIEVDAIRATINERIARVRESSPFAERAQLIQHLTIVAAADGQVDDSEFAEMRRIAVALEIDPMVIEQTLSAAAAPMD